MSLELKSNGFNHNRFKQELSGEEEHGTPVGKVTKSEAIKA